MLFFLCGCDLFVGAYSGGLVQDCSNSIALAMELLQSCTKPFICVQMYLLYPSLLQNMFCKYIKMKYRHDVMIIFTVVYVP